MLNDCTQESSLVEDDSTGHDGVHPKFRLLESEESTCHQQDVNIRRGHPS